MRRGLHGAKQSISTSSSLRSICIFSCLCIGYDGLESVYKKCDAEPITHTSTKASSPSTACIIPLQEPVASTGSVAVNHYFEGKCNKRADRVAALNCFFTSFFL